MARIPEETIEQIAAANDIVEVIGAYFRLKRAGPAYKAICPFHQERTPSFTVNPHRQIYKCFGCGAGGSVFRFVMDYEKVDFATAARRLADRAGIRIVEAELSDEDRARISMRQRLLALHAEAADWFHLQLMKKPSAKPARDYLSRRGVGGDVARSWKIGYAPDAWDSLLGWARERGYSREEVTGSGLVTQREEGGDPYDRFRHRVMFPICNDTGEVIAFSGRMLEADAKGAKYVNSPETALFTKGAVLFGIHRSKRALIEKQSAIVCEGQLDLITAFEAGIQNVIAPQGTAFTDKQARILKRFVDEVVLCFDADAAGQKAAERSLTELLGQGLAVRVVEMPPGEDPDSFIRANGADAFRARVDGARDFFSYQAERLKKQPDFATPRGRAQAARKLAATVSLIGDAVLREAVVSQMTMLLEVSPAEFTKLLVQQTSTRGSEDPLETKVKPAAMDPTLRLMALVALHDVEGRAWLQAAPWKELLEREAEAGLLIRILSANFRVEDPASMQTFLTTLESADEVAVTTLLEERAPVHGRTVASDCWNELVRRQIRRQVDTLQARLRVPGLPDEEVERLQKEILDRQKHALDIARPLSPPL